MNPRATDIYVFDLYGTLVDYASLADRFAGAASDPHAFVAAWRQKQLNYAFAATLMERYVDFDAITAAAFRYAAALHGVPHDDPAERDAERAWSELPAFADALPALRAARRRGFATAVLSNGTPQALAATVRACGFTDDLDAVLSVDRVRRYKPHPDVYRLVVAHFDTVPERVTFVSSNGWDATGASEFGFRSTWCNRGRLPAETFGAAPFHTIATLDALFDD